MGNNRDPRCRQCRREGAKLFLKGEKCVRHCTLDKEKRRKPPGQHGNTFIQKKLTEYGTQLREKQKLRRVYRVLEGQFRGYMSEADRRRGVTGETLLQLLETRLDNVVYRLGLAASRAQARQMVSHRFFRVNDRRVNIASYQVRPGDVIKVDESKSRAGVVREARDKAHTRGLPDWLQFDLQNMVGTVLSVPTRAQIDTAVQEQLIVEFYSR
ncbi:MAG TPA: 30S ribosomal protein S4 [Chthonomonadales bacterium]|nr:30S ribosomal protein S4 [Chthonomonadales bacterium]